MIDRCPLKPGLSGIQTTIEKDGMQLRARVRHELASSVSRWDWRHILASRTPKHKIIAETWKNEAGMG